MTNYSRATSPSYVTPPESQLFPTVYAFLLDRFPRIPASIWLQRIDSQKIHFDDGEFITRTTPYEARRRICYYREVMNEKLIPFEEKILYENENIVIVDKPHFLPIHPAGKFVNETLLTRLAAKNGYRDLCAAHRLDRLTAGIVLCVKKSSVRGMYQNMFMNGTINKTYHAVATLPSEEKISWHICNRLEPYNEHFRMHICPGIPNSESRIELIQTNKNLGLYKLTPITGKKHQLRVHMSSLGIGILNDPLYPTYDEVEKDDDHTAPLQLLAKQLSFIDPLSHEELSFSSNLSLML